MSQPEMATAFVLSRAAASTEHPAANPEIPHSDRSFGTRIRVRSRGRNPALRRSAGFREDDKHVIRVQQTADTQGLRLPRMPDADSAEKTTAEA